MAESEIYMHFQKLNDFENCFANEKALALLKERKPTISRYMPYLRFREMVKSSTLSFVSPIRWEDPFEKIYLNCKIENVDCSCDYVPPRIAGLCFTSLKYKNSAALWKNFKNDNSLQLVRVQYNFMQLIDLLSREAKKMNWNVYIAQVNYELTSDEIKKTDKYLKKIIDFSKSYSAESFYITLLSYKRNAFAFEYEVRLFLVPQKGQLAFDENGILKINNVDYKKIIDRIWLEPIRIPSGWLSKDVVNLELEDFSSKIEQSVMYKEKKKCEHVKADFLWKLK